MVTIITFNFIKRHTKHLVLLLAFALAANIYAVDNIKVKAILDSTEILIGDQVNLSLIVEQPKRAVVFFPVIKDSLSSSLEVVSVSPADTEKIDDENIKITVKYTLTSFDSGYYSIQPIPFGILKSKVVSTVFADSLHLLVNNVQVKDDKVYDIKENLTVPYTLKEILTFALLGLAALLVIALAVYIIIRLHKNKPIFTFEKPAEPAHIIALRELENIKTLKLWQQGQVKQYYSGITDVVRLYIENRFNIPALESTTDELIHYVNEHNIVNDNQSKHLGQLLHLADLVKFAKAEPLSDENDNAWQSAYNFVIETKAEVVTENQTVNQEQKEN
jgi:hypothetical protein